MPSLGLLSKLFSPHIVVTILSDDAVLTKNQKQAVSASDKHILVKLGRC